MMLQADRHNLSSPGNTIEDTVTRAVQEREKQGPWEVEVSYGGEGDLHKHLKGCDKNPGHHKFVPVDQFNVDHLPPGCHDSDLVDLVQAVSDLTVRVSVKYVSDSRPEAVDGRAFPRYKDWGRNMMRVGTGWVWAVYKFPDEAVFNKPCQYQESVNSSALKTQYAHIQIYTALHVVYDSLEAAHTTCHLFFDKGDTPDACSDVVTLSGASIEWTRDDCDSCMMRFMTHDLDLADKLDKMVKHYSHLKNKYYFMWRKEQKLPAEKLSDPGDKLTILVSHPHGCSKQVSVGYCTDLFVSKPGINEINNESNDDSKYTQNTHTYTTATCPGSSGAQVIIVNSKFLFRHWSIVHCGKCEDTNLNFCHFI